MVDKYDSEFSVFDVEEMNLLDELMTLIEEQEIRNGKFIYYYSCDFFTV